MVEIYGLIYGLIGSLCFAAWPIFYKKGSKKLSTLFTNFVRLILPAFLILFYITVIDYWQMILSIKPRILFFIVCASILNMIIADSLYFKAIKYINVARAITISSAYPLFVIIFTGEKFTGKVVLGIALILAGIYIVSSVRTKNGSGNSLEKEAALGKFDNKCILGIISGLMAAVIWGGGITLIKISVSEVSPVIVNFFTLMSSLLIIFSINLFTGKLKAIKTITKYQFINLSAAGAISMFFGSLFLYKGLEICEAGIITTIAATSPIIAAIFSFIFLKEKMTRYLITGIFLSIIGVIIVVA